MDTIKEYIVRVEYDKNKCPDFTHFSDLERAISFAENMHDARPNAHVSLIKQITSTDVLEAWK